MTATRRGALGLVAGCAGALAAPALVRAQDGRGRGRLVLYAGATGSIGRIAVGLLIAEGFRVRGLTRDPADAARRTRTDVQWVAGDVRDPDTLGPAMTGVEFVVCSISYTEFTGDNSPQFVDYMGVRNLADAAKAAGVRHFVLVSAGSSGPFRDHTQNPRFGYVAYWKTKGEAHLKASGVPYTIVGPGGFNNDPGDTRGVRLFPRSAFAFGYITRADVAAITVAALDNPDAVNKAFAALNDDTLAPGAWRAAFAALPPE